MKSNLIRIFLLTSGFIGWVFGCAPELTIEKSPNQTSYHPLMDYQDMVLIPGGEFLMGSTPQNVEQAGALYKKETGREPLGIWFEDEAPAHVVYLDAFYIDKYEVSNGQYKKFIEATNYKKPFNWMDAYFRQTNKPVMGIEWEDAQAFATWAGKRVPTEAEWEKAARGGLMGKLFPWGDKPPQTFRRKYEYVPGKEKIFPGDCEYHMPIGTSESNGYGIYEMTSNVYEWCYDWYAPDYYKNSPAKNPTGPKEGAVRVVRGGSWFQGSFDLRCAYRNIAPPYYRSYYIGFRCVRTAPTGKISAAKNPILASKLRDDSFCHPFLDLAFLNLWPILTPEIRNHQFLILDYL
jgi:iron(II)-dependent oxidoreductase